MDTKSILNRIKISEAEARRLIWMIPSENVVLPEDARLALASPYCNRYNFKYNGNDIAFTLGTSLIDELYDFCTSTLAELFSARFCSAKPISGMNCMTMVISSFSKPGGYVLTLDDRYGGHTHSKAIIEQLGRKYLTIPIIQTEDWFEIDGTKLEQLAEEHPPDLLYIDPMSSLYQVDIETIIQHLPENIYKHYDCSHVFAFIAGGVFGNPLDYGFNSIGGSTHKTIPGGQKAFFACRQEASFRQFCAIGEKLLSSIHPNSIISLSIVLSSCKHLIPLYAQRIMDNALLFSQMLEKHGFKLLGKNGLKTGTHILFLETSPFTSHLAGARALYKSGIVTHPMLLPAFQQKPGLRLGVQELTWLDISTAELELLSLCFKHVLIDNDTLETVKKITTSISEKLLINSNNFERLLSNYETA